MKKMEEAIIGTVWCEVWLYFNVTTWGIAPNTIHIFVCHWISRRKMGPCQDNNRWNVLKTIQSGTDPRAEVLTHGGLANSQQYGSNVTIFLIVSRPKTMAFMYLTPHEFVSCISASLFDFAFFGISLCFISSWYMCFLNTLHGNAKYSSLVCWNSSSVIPFFKLSFKSFSRSWLASLSCHR